MTDCTTYQGNCPGNVSKDAKYSVRNDQGKPVVTLTYNTDDGERWHMTTDTHPKLVAMVNAAKISKGGDPNGAFYINEYKQVIVPVVGCDKYFLAGEYSTPLRFEFEDKTLSGEAIDPDGNPLQPGDLWKGPHPGIPYTLTAGGKDVKYRISPRPNVTRDVKLSKEIGKMEALKTVNIVKAVKGSDGGRFYINEFLTMFTPINEEGEWVYRFIGILDLEHWFPKVE